MFLDKGCYYPSIWIESNDLLFNNVKWHDAKLKRVMWDNLIKCNRFEWQHVQQQIKRYIKDNNIIIKFFDRMLGIHHTIYSFHGMKVR
jgi:hypothetical protein